MVELLQDLHIHTRLIIISLGKSPGYDLHQIVIAQIILRKKNQMVIPVVPASYCFFIKPGAWRHIDFAAQDRLDADGLGSPVKINNAEHDAMIRDRYAVHSQFLDSGNTFFNFVGTVQQTVLCMNVKMCKTHIPSHFLSVNIVDCPVFLYYTKKPCFGEVPFSYT